MALRWLQRTGHRPIVLVGGATTRIGDPSFRDTSRPLLADDDIGRNALSLRQVFSRYLAFDDGPTGAILVDNRDWLDRLRFIPALREVGPHVSVNRMLALDSVRVRLSREEPLSLLEFNYLVLQSFDFLELARRHDCALQLGGSDQWANIVGGVELGRRLDGRRLFGLTMPLLTGAAGTKMGKSGGNAVWLNPDRLDRNAFWRFWRATHDDDVARFLRLFTELPLAEISRLAGPQGGAPEEAKEVLADEVTRLARADGSVGLPMSGTRDAVPATCRQTARRAPSEDDQ
jgi:tyrosyl-tRNA synthetase